MYEVSNMGRVRGLRRYVKGKAGSRMVINGRTLRPVMNKGYERVHLCNDGVLKNANVHSLVCTAFHGPCPPGMECMHINGIRTDNRAENLIWGTSAENNSDPIRKMRLREAHTRGRFDFQKRPVGQYDIDGNLIKVFDSAHAAAREVGAFYQNILNCCHKKKNTSVGYIWKFV